MAFTEQQIQTLKLMLETQAEGYKDTINRLNADFKEIRKEYNEVLYDLRKSLEFTQKDCEDMKKEISHMKIENGKLNAMVISYKNDITHIQSKEKQINEQIDLIDDRSRKSNLILSGIPEMKEENNEQCHKKTHDLLKEKLEIPNPDLKSAYRIGKPQSGKIRDVLVKFNKIEQRDMILRKKKTLKGQQLFIKEDFCRNTIQIRNALLPELQDARRQGKYAYINYRELIVKGNRNLNTEYKKNNDNTKVQQAVSVIEQTLEGVAPTSPLPSPFLAPSHTAIPHTPPRRSNENYLNEISKDNSTQLRPRNQIRYPK